LDTVIVSSEDQTEAQDDLKRDNLTTLNQQKLVPIKLVENNQSSADKEKQTSTSKVNIDPHKARLE